MCAMLQSKSCALHLSAQIQALPAGSSATGKSTSLRMILIQPQGIGKALDMYQFVVYYRKGFVIKFLF